MPKGRILNRRQNVAAADFQGTIDPDLPITAITAWLLTRRLELYPQAQLGTKIDEKMTTVSLLPSRFQSLNSSM